VSGPLVSIIVVLYNSAGYIAPCVEALSGLTYRPLELIMVDNASSDGSAGLARRALEEAGLEASMSIAPRNRGFAAANNHGVSLSSTPTRRRTPTWSRPSCRRWKMTAG
jgi:teichuronic acid biosynthesis glycosyltransferase TuaG